MLDSGGKIGYQERSEQPPQHVLQGEYNTPSKGFSRSSGGCDHKLS